MIELLLAAENALALGLVDQAERTYLQVLASDPRNGIAAVGLARVALERGDEAGAIRLARNALEIDPENAAARRMIDRLEEVARFRGEVVGSAGGLVGDDLAGLGDEPLGPAQPAGPLGPPPPAVPPPAVPPPGAASPDPPPPAELPPAPQASPTPARSGLLRRLLRRP